MLKYLLLFAAIVFVILNLDKKKPKQRAAERLREKGVEAIANITEKSDTIVKGEAQHFLHINVLMNNSDLLMSKLRVNEQTYSRYAVDDDIYVRFDPENPQMMLASEEM